MERRKTKTWKGRREEEKDVTAPSGRGGQRGGEEI